jgi:hypothetical protein
MQTTAPRLRTFARDISFALDFHDPDLYVSTFTPDGVLDYGRASSRGRPAQHFEYRHQGKRRQSIRPLVLVSLFQRQPPTQGRLRRLGHYEDELVKTNGKWLFTKRKIYNEGRDE